MAAPNVKKTFKNQPSSGKNVGKPWTLYRASPQGFFSPYAYVSSFPFLYVFPLISHLFTTSHPFLHSALYPNSFINHASPRPHLTVCSWFGCDLMRCNSDWALKLYRRLANDVTLLEILVLSRLDTCLRCGKVGNSEEKLQNLEIKWEFICC